jgi:hypothetical protein
MARITLKAERGAATIHLPPSLSGTPEQQRPGDQLDMATLHLAMHAVGYTLLETLFPQRAAGWRCCG